MNLSYYVEMKSHVFAKCSLLLVLASCGGSGDLENSSSPVDDASAPETTAALISFEATAEDATPGNLNSCWEFGQPFDPSNGSGDDIRDSAGRMSLLGRNSDGRLRELFAASANSILQVGPYYARDEFPPQSLIDEINRYSSVISSFCSGVRGFLSTTTSSAPSAVAISRNNPQIPCAEGGACERGDLGPGGGIVIVAFDEPQAWGQFIEAAPSGWSGGSDDPAVPWCNKQVFESSLQRAYRFGFGAGKENTNAIAPLCSEGAITLSKEYRGGGKSDWYLPSRDEAEFFSDAIGLSTDTGPISDSFPWYWTSTGNPSCVGMCAYAVLPEDGKVNDYGHFDGGKPDLFYVRPVRAFF
jgi:hypothetical protein